MLRQTRTAIGLALLGAVATAQGEGTLLYEGVELDDLTQTEAKSFEDLQGRTILIEFFAYW